ncbi:MAG: hypothetical protein P1U63_10195 [Coxiellaceae bacterium]|nr:hypothetical protein [Coxiellaceae bacterium]
MKKMFIQQFTDSLFNEYTTPSGKLLAPGLIDPEYATGSSMQFFAALVDLRYADEVALFDFTDTLPADFDLADTAKDIQTFMRAWIKQHYQNETTFAEQRSILDIPAERRCTLDGCLFDADELCQRITGGKPAFINPHTSKEFSSQAQTNMLKHAVLIEAFRQRVQSQRKREQAEQKQMATEDYPVPEDKAVAEEKSAAEDKSVAEAKLDQVDEVFVEPAAEPVLCGSSRLFAAPPLPALTEAEVHAINLIPAEYQAADNDNDVSMMRRP